MKLADWITLVRVPFIVLYAYGAWMSHTTIMVFSICMVLISDLLDGRVARAHKTSGYFGDLLDGGVDFLFMVTAGFFLVYQQKVGLIALILLVVLFLCHITLFAAMSIKRKKLYFPHRLSIKPLGPLGMLALVLYIFDYPFADWVLIGTCVYGLTFFLYDYIKNEIL